MAHVAADSSSSSVADQLSVRLDQEYRVKLGRSFTFPEQNSFHTIKYDFKPQSVDSTKPGNLKVTDDEVNVSLPVVSQGDLVEDFTYFRGNKKPCTKECILIINTRTGEAILEKISNNVNLKAVRDGRKPAAVNRDRSVSPSPLMMQSKGHSASKSQLSTGGGHRHLTPSPIPSATPTTSNNSTPLATKGGGASSGSNVTQGNCSKKGQKRQTKSKTPKTPAIVPTSATKQESKGRNGSKPKAKKKSESSTKQASIPTAPKIKTEPAVQPAVQPAPQATSSFQAAAMSSMPLLGMGMERTREISPIHSNNPTPEPPSRKKQKISPLTRNSSSSSSDSSDSDSEGEEPMSQAPPNQQPLAQFSSVPVTRVTSAQSQVGSGNNMPVFSHRQPIAQKGHIAQKSHPAQLPQANIPPPPNQRLSSGSSSGSDSDSSSGSSSSDSSSDSSDEENDKEVAALSRGPVAQGQRAYQRSYSELKSDLQLSSDSGSSSD